jgi:hypothetical protein
MIDKHQKIVYNAKYKLKGEKCYEQDKKTAVEKMVRGFGEY